MVTVAAAIEPRVAPPPGWLSVRLKVEKLVVTTWVGEDRNREALSVWHWRGKISVPETAV